MSILADLLLDVLGAGLGPTSDRGVIATFTVGSLGLSVAAVWLLTASADLTKRAAWGPAVLIATLLCGAGGLLVSVLHVRRNQSDRIFAFVCLTVNLAAIAVAALWLLSR